MKSQSPEPFKLPRLSYKPPPRDAHSFITMPEEIPRPYVTQTKKRKDKYWKFRQIEVASKDKLLQNCIKPKQLFEPDPSDGRFGQEMAVQSKEESLYDARQQKMVGEEAINNYYKHYKKLNKIVQLNSVRNTPNSPMTSILTESQKLNVFPGCYGIVKERGDSGTLSLGNYRLGDKYCSVVSSGLKEMKDVHEYLFSKNRLSNKGFGELLSAINPQAIKLDFSCNNIDQININLIKIITQPQSKLEYINFENNRLGDEAFQTLRIALTVSKTIRYLNVSKNLLTRNSCSNISLMIDRMKSLEQLYIGWNKINGPDAKMVFQSLSKNSTIVVFDYSNNSLGQALDIDTHIGNFFMNNTKVLHLDLSYNQFTLSQCQQMAQSLKRNHSIYGLHFSGNHGYINYEGFLIFDEQSSLQSVDTVRRNKIKSLSVCRKRMYSKYDSTVQKDICWICQGWVETTIHGQVATGQNPSEFSLHFSFDSFGMKQCLVPPDGNFKISLMFPPTTTYFFYMLNGNPHTFRQFFSESPGLQKDIQIGKTGKVVTVPSVNIIHATGKKVVNDGCGNQVLVSVVPRSSFKEVKKKKEWTYKDSVWAREWKSQDSQLLKKCFERDWSHSKIPNVVKNQEDQDKVKALLYLHYKNIKEIYKYFASWSPFGDVWAISMNPFTQFCYQAGMISKQLPSKIIDLTFITTNSISGADWRGNSLVPERGLTRFQFMESLVRLADEKYRKNGIFQTFSQSVSNLIENHLKPIFPRYQTDKWRHNTYYTEQNDTLIKNLRPIFKEVYKKNSKMKVKPGEKAFMCLDQFKDICQRMGILGLGSIVERDCFINFNCSMMTQVDEVESQRIFRMTEIEFIQAMARLSEYIDLKTIKDTKEPKAMHYRFEELINQMCQTICSEDLRNQFPLPTISIFDESLQQ